MNRAKGGGIRSNGVKQGQMGPNSAKWGLMGPKTGPNGSNRANLCLWPNGTKSYKHGKTGSTGTKSVQAIYVIPNPLSVIL